MKSQYFESKENERKRMKMLYSISMCYYRVQCRSIQSSNRYPFSYHINTHRALTRFNMLRPATINFRLGLSAHFS